MAKAKEKPKNLGPGIITGAADVDPAGIATFCQAGAMFGYKQLWTALYFFPLMSIIQEMCGRIGMITGKGLAKVIDDNYARPIVIVNILVLISVNIITIGADLGAMASCLESLLKLPFTASLLAITLVTICLQIYVPYKIFAKYLSFLALILVSYIITAFFVKQSWHEIALSTFIPYFTFEKKYITNIMAILGTTLSPYLFFWQAGQEVEEAVADKKISEMNVGKPRVSAKMLLNMRFNTILGMFFSNAIMWFIILTTASTLHVNGITSVDTADQAAQALKPFAGDFAFIIFSMGIIGSGLLAIPTLAGSSGYAFCETFKFKQGLSKKFRTAPIFYMVIIISTMVGLLVNYLSIPPFKMLYYTAIINGVCSPPLLIMILLICNNKKIMGTRTNSVFINIMGLFITGIMILASVGFIIQLFMK